MVKKTVSLITYNIHKGFGFGALRFLLPEMKEALGELNPDFVFLQEVQGKHKRKEKRIEAWPPMPQFEYLAQKQWPYVLYAGNAVYQSGHHGNAILSKYPLECYENVNLSKMSRASRGFLYSQLYLNDENNTKIHLLCVHLGLFKQEREEQCQALMKRIRELIPRHEPLIMAGDFNDWRQHLSEPLQEELGIFEAFFSHEGGHARSFPSIRPSLRMDRVYFRGMDISEVKSLQGKPWKTLSDHIPLFARFTLL